MSSLVLEVIALVLLVLLNGLLSMAEIALLSCRKTRMRQLAEEGDMRAQIVLDLTRDSPRLLSTVQAGVSLVGICTGALGGTVLAGTLANGLTHLGIPGWLGGTLGFVIVVVLVTYLTLIAGELIPKQIALSDGDGIALRLARTLLVFSKALGPAARILSWSSSAVLRFFRVSAPSAATVGAEEIAVLIEESIEGGKLRPREERIVRSAVSFTAKRVWELMTPRADVVWMERGDTRDVVRQRLADTTHSRFPVCDGGLDTVVGMVRAKDILDAGEGSGERALETSMSPPVFVPVNALALLALQSMRAERSDIALAVDEYGILQGLVTTHDILRALVEDEHSAAHGADGLAVERPDGTWLMDGLLETTRFKDIFALRNLPEEEIFRTLGGFIMAHLGRVPKPSDEVRFAGIRLEIVTMVGNRVGKVRAVNENAGAERLPSDTQR